MDVTRKTLAAFAALLFLFSAWPTAAAADAPRLILMEVCPASPVEFVRLVNGGMETMDLAGWSVGDGEGSITFSKGMALAAGDALVLTSNATVAAAFFDRSPVDYRDQRLLRQGTFQLANGGDQVFLRSPQGVVADVLVYGDASVTAPWIGKPLRTIAKNSDALRVDAGKWSASAWTISVPGRSDLSPGYFDCWAGVFTAPEEATEEVLAFIEAAQTSLVLCTYQFEHPGITTLLAEKARNGVNISLLVEGEPVAGIGDASVSQLHFLERSGANVSIMLSRDGYRRYDFVHAKYIVADGRRLLVMSENLVDEALQHNRGWGAVLESQEAAQFLLQMFAADVDYRKGDVLPAGQAFERTKTFSAGSSTAHSSKLELVQCRMRFAISPETSLETLLSLVTNARSRLLLEEMQADYEDLNLLGLAPALVDAAALGVQVRVLLDSSLDKKDGENRHFVQSIGPGVEARLASDDHAFTTIHNKGIVSDDTVLVSSINLGSTSIGENRELGVVLESKILADRMALLFSSDWSNDSNPPSIVLPWKEITVEEGAAVTLDGSLCRDPTLPLTFDWDVDGDGVAELEGQRVIFHPSAGVHLINLTVTDREGNAATAALMVNARPNPIAGIVPFLAAAIIIPSALLAWKRIKRK